MKSDNSKDGNPAWIPQLSSVKRDLIQVGRDYIRNIQINIAAENWIMVAILVALPILGSYLTVKTAGYVVNEIQSAQIGPGRGVLQQQLQNQLPSFLEITQLDFERHENLGTQVEPVIAARFKATAKFKEDAFLRVNGVDDIPSKRQENVNFLKLANSKGSSIDIYGVLKTKRVADSWETQFEFEHTPTFGRSRDQYNGRTVLLGSDEETKFRAEVEAEVKAEKEAVLNPILNKASLSGERSKTEGELHSFVLTFTSFDSLSKTFTGEMQYPDAKAVVKIEGSIIEDTQIQFKSTEILKGGGKVKAVGSTYSLSLVNLSRMEGKREKLQRLPEALLPDLSPFGPNTNEEEPVVLYLK
ncbi:MAG: hypothetical protein KME13_17245 [Myxacorys californica WJT36-NPBG1]|jgi:hypothetical protein|nr:hypothetical protein [Myxacorys californica WJT36-NPBG1]